MKSNFSREILPVSSSNFFFLQNISFFVLFLALFFRLLAKIKKKLDLVRKANKEREKLKLKKASPFPQF